ncbi:hypothetical protein BGX31_010225 [Mortierella sp. GBA43]|nr:hypothetical protein BGX31_010225 [Mortierella sp. GBA43]
MSDSSSPSSSSISETITATILSTITNTITATATPTATLYPVPTDAETQPSPNDGYYRNLGSRPDQLCDWTRTATNCRDSDFTKAMLVVSSAVHLIVALYGVWLLSYRNRGFNKGMVTELFSKIGSGVRPKPMDCIIFFTSIACLVKVAANLPLVFGALQGLTWLRVAIEQLYWVLIAFAFSAYFVGLLYAMPVTTRQGIFAVYQPEAVFGTKPMAPIHVLTPTTSQKNFILAMGLIYPLFGGAGLGIAAGVLFDRGEYGISRTLVLVQYSNWVVILYTMAIMFFYYGLKYTFILRANIIIAETALKAPRAAFGIGNLKSRSPARFLFIQLQITGFGGCAVTVLAGTLCGLWVLLRGTILDVNSDRWPHVMAVFWTCAIAVAFFVVFSLIAAQSIRSRRRAHHDPSSTASVSHSGGNKSSAHRASKSGHHYSHDPEAQLTQPSSCDDSIDSEKISLERYEDPRLMVPEDSLDRDKALAAASVAAMMAISERMDLEANAAAAAAAAAEARRGSLDRESLTPSSPSGAKPLTIQVAAANAGANNNHSNIRESVFGGRTPREDGTTSPTGGFSMPSFPLMAIRSTSRNSMQRERPSTSSHTASNTQTASSSSRHSILSSKHGTSSSESYNTLSLPTQPVSPVVSPAMMLQQQTQLQLQLLEQPQTQRNVQRVQVGAGGSNDGGGGDLLYNDAMRSQQQASSPPQSPTRTRTNTQGQSKSPISITMPPNMTVSQQQYYNELDDEGLPLPLPPTSSKSSSSSPRVPTSPSRASPSSPRTGTYPSEFSLGPDMQLQQQHPLHQVAYKGLSPPPRSNPQSPVSSTSPGRRRGGSLSSPPMSPTATTPSSPGLQGQPSPRLGGGVRRGTSSSSKSRDYDREPSSEPAVPMPSRGAGGGYHRADASLTAVPVPVLQAPPRQQQQQQQQQSQQPQSLRNKNTMFQQQQRQDVDDNASDSAGDDAWPMPPTFRS